MSAELIPSPQSSLDAFDDMLARDRALAFELAADERVDIVRDAALMAAVGLGALPMWAAFSADRRVA